LLLTSLGDALPVDFGSLITFADCVLCRKCCIFTEDELVEAPLFNDEQRELATQVADETLIFDRHGDLWQLRLKQAEQGHRWVCPLLEAKSGACKVQANKPLNCSIYPAHVAINRDGIVLAITNVCPVVNDERRLRPRVDQYASERLARTMRSVIQQHPEFIIPFRDDAMTAIEILQPS
jgi:Fe-S-cluster containining protein